MMVMMVMLLVTNALCLVARGLVLASVASWCGGDSDDGGGGEELWVVVMVVMVMMVVESQTKEVGWWCWWCWWCWW